VVVAQTASLALGVDALALDDLRRGYIQSLLGRCQNTFPVTTGSPHRPTPRGGGGGVVAGLATPGGRFCTLYDPPGGRGRRGAGPEGKLRRTGCTFRGVLTRPHWMALRTWPVSLPIKPTEALCELP
jgi:hypothetical protein